MKYRYLVNGLDCANCARKIEGHLNDDEKLRNVVLNFSTSKLSFEAEEDRNMKEFIELKIICSSIVENIWRCVQKSF